MRRIARAIGSVVLVGMAGGSLAASNSTPSPRLAVERFVKSGYPFERSVDRKYALHGRIEEVTRELGANRLSTQQIFAFPRRAGAPITSVLVAVDLRGTVELLDDVRSFNTILTHVPVELPPEELARLIADTFLKVLYFDGLRNHRYPLGINVVEHPGQIPGLGGSSAAEEVRAPELDKDLGTYRLTIYSWTPAGGALTRHRVSVAENQVSDYEVETLQQWVGAHGPSH